MPGSASQDDRQISLEGELTDEIKIDTSLIPGVKAKGQMQRPDPRPQGESALIRDCKIHHLLRLAQFPPGPLPKPSQGANRQSFSGHIPISFQK